jgi:predicted enzyme related to lactoylglutathione lyase
MPSYVIDYFELPAPETEPSQGFFGRAFGFGRTDYGPGYSEIIGAGVLGAVNASGESSAPLIGIRTDDIAAAQRAIQAAGGTITRPTYDYPGGQRLFFREPGGNEMLVYCPSA